MNKKYLVLMIVIAVFFRIWLTQITFHQDLLSQANWGLYVSQTGTKDFYTQDKWIFSWPNHPPLTSLYYGYCHKMYLGLSLRLNQSLLVLNKVGIEKTNYANFVDSFDEIVSPEIPFNLGFLISLKLVPVIFDVLIALLTFFMARSITYNNGYKYFLIYLLSPFSWYISGLWGQTDQMSFFLTIISFLLLSRFPILSIILFYIGGSIKPTSVLLMPLFLWMIVVYHVDFRKILVAGILCLILNFIIFVKFTDVNVIDFTFNTLLPRIFDRPPRLTTNAYNFWHIFALDEGWSNITRFLNVPATVWAGFFYVVINWLAFRIARVKNIKSTVSAVFIVSFGSWLFLTDMLDRYLFTGIVSCLLLTIYYPKMLKYWFILSLVYWLNLFRGWWFPEMFSWVKYLLTAHNYIGGLFLSLGNLIVYLRILIFLIRKEFLRQPNYRIY